MVRLAGFEPATFGSGDRRSNPTELQARDLLPRTCRCLSYHASLRGVQSGTAVNLRPNGFAVDIRAEDRHRKPRHRGRLLGRDCYTTPGSIGFRAVDHGSVRKNRNPQRSRVFLLGKER